MSEVDVFQEDKFNHAVKVAQTLAKSSIVPLHFKGKPEDIFACLVLGAELGFKPIQSLNSIVMIQGNATLKAVTMLAIARSKIKDLSVNIEELNNAVRVTIKRGEDSYTALWSDEKAKAMGLSHKDNYIKQKMTMYRWRAISEALKIICPDVLMGLNTLEEMQDAPETMSQSLRREVEEDFPTPPEELACGPFYRFAHGKFIGKQLKDVSLVEIEGYLEYLIGKKNKNTWQTEMCYLLSDYVTRYEEFKPMLTDIENGVDDE